MIEALAGIYVLGVIVGLFAIDASPLHRLGLALLWPLGPLAFVVTISILLLAAPIAFPLVGTLVLAALAVVFALIVSAEPLDEARTRPAPTLEARFIGNMAFAISDGTTTLLTDFPYESGYSIYMEYDVAEIRSPTARSLALITHRHRDHWDKALFEKTSWKVVAPEDALAGVAAARVIGSLPVAPAKNTLTFENLSIHALPTPHANIGHYSYLVTWHGRRLYFTGDTDDDTQLQEMTNLDVAFVSPWLYQNARKNGRKIDARRIVIYHHTTGDMPPTCLSTCSVPRQGDILRF